MKFKRVTGIDHRPAEIGRLVKAYIESKKAKTERPDGLPAIAGHLTK